MYVYHGPSLLLYSRIITILKMYGLNNIGHHFKKAKLVLVHPQLKLP